MCVSKQFFSHVGTEPPLLRYKQMSRPMRKPTTCIGENKDADQLRGNREADQRLCFRYSVQFLFFLNLKFLASSSFMCLYRLVCVGPVRKPHCWFSHEVAQIIGELVSILVKDITRPQWGSDPGPLDFYAMITWPPCSKRLVAMYQITSQGKRSKDTDRMANSEKKSPIMSKQPKNKNYLSKTCTFVFSCSSKIPLFQFACL